MRTSLPPAITDALLIDWEGLTAWDAQVLSACNRPTSPEAVLDAMRTLHRHAACWRPGALPLADWLAGWTPATPPDRADTLPIDWSLDALIREAVPPELAAPSAFADARTVWDAGLRRAWGALGPMVRRYLAARSIACWPLHAGRGLSTQIRYLEALLVVLRGEIARRIADPASPVPHPAFIAAIRETDRLALHLADPVALASRLDARR